MMKITYRGTKNIMHQATWLNYPRKIPQGHQRRRTEAPVRVVFRAWCTFLENERQRQYIDRRVKLTVSNDPGRPCSTYCTITKLYYKKKRLEPFWNISTPFPSFFVFFTLYATAKMENAKQRLSKTPCVPTAQKNYGNQCVPPGSNPKKREASAALARVPPR
jgi:hypothetical protein